MNTKVYISGPISGLDYDEAFDAFSKAEYAIKQKNPCVTVVNPMRLPIPKDVEWTFAMRECLKAMMECGYIHMLPGSEKSEGARLEFFLAEKLGFGVCNDKYELVRYDD